VYVLLEFGKNIGDPFYEPTIMVHNMLLATLLLYKAMFIMNDSWLM